MSKYPGRIVTDLAPAGYSVAFDGTGDYLNASPTALGSGNFTIECWVYLTGSVASKGIFHVATSSVLPGTVSGVAVASGSSGGWTFYYNNGTQNTNTSLTAALNTWIHIAVVKSGTTISLYINGILNQSQTDTANYTNQVAAIGGFFSTAYLMTGNISNFRMVNSALYSGTSTTTANFNLPTQLLNITNTSLLTCNSPAIIDQSNNAFAITVNGDSKVSTFTPFTAYVPYNPALGASTPGVWTVDEALQAKGTRQWNMYDPSFNLTTLLLHGNGTNTAQNNTFLDSSSNNFSITRNPASGPNAPTQGSFSPFSQTGWSNFFNGSTDYISVADNAAFTLGSGDFTIEFWVYSTTAGTRQFFAGQMNSAGANISVSFSIEKTSGNKLLGAINSGTTQYAATSSGDIPLNAWTHIALVRDGNTLRQYINGVQDGTVSVTGVTANDSSSQLAIGRVGEFTSNYYFGYISNFRFVKGTCLYTGGTTFTPPTSPLTNITNTSLLTCQSNRFVDNSTANSGSGFAITPNGTPSVQAFSPFYSTAAYTPATVGGSGYFDGTGDFLSAAYTSAFDLSTGDFTVEGWYYPTTASGARAIVCVYGGGGIQWYVGVVGTSWDVFVYPVGSVLTITTGAAPAINQWVHFALVRDGANFKFYVQGVLTATVASQTLRSVTQPLNIGTYSDGGGGFFQGNIGQIRIVKGACVYTGAFTPPRAPLATSGAASASAYSSTTNVNTSFAASATSLLCNFTNAGIVDSTAKNVLETVGNAQISTTQSKFGGSSIAFDGTGDYLVFPANPLYAFGTGDFTVEAWVYPTSNAAVLNICGTRTSAGTVNGWNWGILTNGSSQMYSNSAIANTGASTVPLNTWTHLAFVRTGGTIYGYVNGVQRGSTANTENFTINTFWVGITGGTAEPFFGYIDDLRITRFARYTGNFTPQTSQWQDE